MAAVTAQAEVAQHSEDSPVAARIVLTQPELGEDVRHVTLHRRIGDDECLGDAPVRLPLCHQAENVTFTGSQLAEWVAAAPTSDESADNLGVDHRSAMRDSPNSVDEVSDPGHAALQQVADALGSIGQQVGDVSILEIVGEDEHADAGIRRADLLRCLEPVIAEVRWHLDVDDGDVRGMGVRLGHEVTRVARRRHDVKAGAVQSMHHPLPEERLILSHDDADRGARLQVHRTYPAWGR